MATFEVDIGEDFPSWGHISLATKSVARDLDVK